MNIMKLISNCIFVLIMYAYPAIPDEPVEGIGYYLEPLASTFDVGQLAYDEILYNGSYFHQITFLDKEEPFDRVLLSRGFDFINIPDNEDERAVFQQKALYVEKVSNQVVIEFSIPSEKGEVISYFFVRPGRLKNNDGSIDMPSLESAMIGLLFCQAELQGIRCMKINF